MSTNGPEPGWFDRVSEQIKASRSKILLDMDGVLVNFIAGALKVHNGHIPYSEIIWNFFTQLGIPEEEFWKPCGREFWGNLEWHAGGRELIQELMNTYGVDRIALCTSSCDTDGCIDGKMDWIRREVPFLRRNFMITPIKQFAAKGNILIDDSPENCKKFQAAGGQTVLVPQPWNNRWQGELYNFRDIVSEVVRKV